MTNNELINKVNEVAGRLQRALNDLATIKKMVISTTHPKDSAGHSRKTRSDRLYLSEADRQRAYRERKKQRMHYTKPAGSTILSSPSTCSMIKG